MWHDRRVLSAVSIVARLARGTGRVGCACVSVAPVAACRGAVPASATGLVRRAGREAEADRYSDAGELGAAVPAIRMALRTGRRAPADPDSLAPSGFQAPLEMEVPPGAATDSNGAEAAHPADGAGESTVGSGTLRQRAVGEARTACLAADRAEVSTETASGSAAWRPALVDALGFDTHYGYLLHDRDSIFSRELDAAVGGFGLRILKTPPRCPMANGLCERVIGMIRRECLGWLIPLSEAHLRRAPEILGRALQPRQIGGRAVSALQGHILV